MWKKSDKNFTDSWRHILLCLCCIQAKCALCAGEFEKRHQGFGRVPFGGHHMLDELKQSVNMRLSMGGPQFSLYEKTWATFTGTGGLEIFFLLSRLIWKSSTSFSLIYKESPQWITQNILLISRFYFYTSSLTTTRDEAPEHFNLHRYV